MGNDKNIEVEEWKDNKGTLDGRFYGIGGEEDGVSKETEQVPVGKGRDEDM